MTDTEWKEYRRQAEKGEPYEIKSGEALALLDERDGLRKALKQSVAAMSLALTRIPYGDKEPKVIRELKSAIQVSGLILPTERNCNGSTKS